MRSFALKTWNCFGAAQSATAFLRWRGIPDAHRLAHPEVLAAVCAADVLCMQEVFLSEAEAFFEALDHAHKARDHNRSTWWPLTVAGSGLAIASRFPLVASAIRPFRCAQVGAERFARKGALFARVCVVDDPPLYIDVITTHFQAGYDRGARLVRAAQLRELRAFVDEVADPSRTFVICGDHNLDGLAPVRGGEYAELRAALPEFDDLGAAEDHPTFHPHPDFNELAHRFERKSPPQRIDYVLLRPATGAVRAEPCEVALRSRLTCASGLPTTYASDHFALRVRLHCAR